MGGSYVGDGVVVAFAVVAAALVVYPDPVAHFVNGPKKDGAGEDGASSFWAIANLLRIVHLTGFATAFGTGLWVSFIGGIIMFKHLPRHQFGNLQSHMFPAYFGLSSLTIASSIAILSVLHPWTSSTLWEKVQFVALGLALIFHLTNLLVLEPMTTKLMRERHKAEKEDGISTEPGVNRKKEIEKAGPKLRDINKKFFAAHGMSSLINLFAIWGLFVHVFYLGGRISF